MSGGWSHDLNEVWLLENGRWYAWVWTPGKKVPGKGWGRTQAQALLAARSDAHGNM